MKKFLSVTTLLVLGVSGCQNMSKADSVKVIDVSPSLVDCVGVAPMKCMKIREVGQADWQLMYDQINGFNFEEGYQYRLKVKVEKREEVPADASSQIWTLVEEINKSK